MTKGKILVVDDSAMVLNTLALVLRSDGYDVVMAEDGSEAVTCARLEHPDLILLDINFPPDVTYGGSLSWDGFRLIDWMRQTHASLAPIILITGDDIEGLKERAKQSGAIAIFQKPLDNDALLSMIQRVLEASRNQTQPQPRVEDDTQTVRLAPQSD